MHFYRAKNTLWIATKVFSKYLRKQSLGAPISLPSPLSITRYILYLVWANYKSLASLLALLSWNCWNNEIEGAESIFTRLWITFWGLFKADRQKSIPQISTRVFLKKHNSLLSTTTSWISKSNTRMRILFPARSPRIVTWTIVNNWLMGC